MNPIEIYHGRQPTQQERRAESRARESVTRARLGAEIQRRRAADPVPLLWAILVVEVVAAIALWAVARG